MAAIIIAVFASATAAFGQSQMTLKGIVCDHSTGECLAGATVRVAERRAEGVVSGLDGSFAITTSADYVTLICSYIGYETLKLTVASATTDLTIRLHEIGSNLGEITVTAKAAGNTDASARLIERQSMNVVNVLSARAMELSPDVTVGNVVQRMSGVTVERNSSGEGQYAIVRGMDKRYNYTLVNGVKIPSPDNKNRFVPLDIFPSEMLDRIEVSKSMTANMEGDGVGGAVNLVMKDAPSRRLFSASLTTGYNATFLDRSFLSFNHPAIADKSPGEIKGITGDYGVTAADFTGNNLRVNSHHPLPDLLGSLTWGDRFIADKLGIVAAVSYQNLNRGKNSDWYYRSSYMTNGVEYREYSENQRRAGLHIKADYLPSSNHKLTLYAGYVDMQEAQARQAVDDRTATVRLRWNHQTVLNTTLGGEHQPTGRLALRWKAVYSHACNKTPDNATLNFQGTHVAASGAASRRWEHNSDRDYAGYVDADYWSYLGSGKLTISAGGMYRDKKRDSFFNEYTFDSSAEAGVQVYGSEWSNLDEIAIDPRPYGNIGDPLNYDATERIAAGYAMAKYTLATVEAIAGLRMEHTKQSYLLDFPRNVDPEGSQTYTDWLPSLHVKYKLARHTNLRFSYSCAINRPSFFEIVPYSIINEEYKERGNPALLHTVANNVDLRWEYFPGAAEQLMAGVFFKHLKNPIEYGLVNEGQDTYYMPMNLGNAVNMGLEIDLLKYFNKFGIKANYTFTHSRITTDKRTMEGNEIRSERQSRPLFGQAAHVANLSLLYKDTSHGIDAQLTTAFIGKRLSDISNWLDNDIWENNYCRLELSGEKALGRGLSLFVKASNLLNLPLVRYYHKGPHTDQLTEVRRTGGNVVERRERYGQTLLLGIRLKIR